MAHKEEEELNSVSADVLEEDVDMLIATDDLDDPLDDEILDDELITDEDIDEEEDDFVGLDGSSDY